MSHISFNEFVKMNVAKLRICLSEQSLAHSVKHFDI